jgi:hypothetical protein
MSEAFRPEACENHTSMNLQNCERPKYYYNDIEATGVSGGRKLYRGQGVVIISGIKSVFYSIVIINLYRRTQDMHKAVVLIISMMVSVSSAADIEQLLSDFKAGDIDKKT